MKGKPQVREQRYKKPKRGPIERLRHQQQVRAWNNSLRQLRHQEERRAEQGDYEQ